MIAFCDLHEPTWASQKVKSSRFWKGSTRRIQWNTSSTCSRLPSTHRPPPFSLVSSCRAQMARGSDAQWPWGKEGIRCWLAEIKRGTLPKEQGNKGITGQLERNSTKLPFLGSGHPIQKSAPPKSLEKRTTGCGCAQRSERMSIDHPPPPPGKRCLAPEPLFCTFRNPTKQD